MLGSVSTDTTILGKKSHWFFLILSIALFVIFALGMYFHPLTQDEGVFLVIGNGLKKGLLPYVDFFDHKLPAIYFIDSWLLSISGNILFLKSFYLLINLLSAGVLATLAKNRTHQLIIFSAYLFGLIFLEGQRLVAEPIMALLISISLLIFSKKEISNLRFFVLGLIFGALLLLKQTGLLPIFGLLIIYYKNFNFKKSLITLAGVFLPLVITLFWLIEKKILGQAASQIFLANLHYPSEDLLVILKYNFLTVVMTLPLWLGLIFAIKLKKISARFLWPIILTLPLLFYRHYPHYWLTILPFVALYSSYGVERILTTTRFPIILLIIILLAYATREAVIVENQRSIDQEILTEKIKSQPETALYTENAFTAQYFLSNKKPINQNLYLTEVNPPNASQEIISQIRINKPLIVWIINKKYLKNYQLDQYIEENYQEIDRIEQANVKIMRAKTI